MGHIEIVSVLLKHRAKVNKVTSGGFSPLHVACKENHEKIVEKLINQYAFTNISDNNGLSPLHVACSNGYIPIVKCLLGRNAEVNQKTKDGKSPLHVAVDKGFLEVAQMLLKYHASVDIEDTSGSTPLHTACEKGHFNIVKLLIKRNANVNHVNRLNASPLFIACTKGHRKVVDMLLRNDADVNMATKKGHTPFSVAMSNGYDDITEILTNTGHVKTKTKHTNDGRGIAQTQFQDNESMGRLATIYSIDESEPMQNEFEISENFKYNNSNSDNDIGKYEGRETISERSEALTARSEETNIIPELIKTERSSKSIKTNKAVNDRDDFQSPTPDQQKKFKSVVEREVLKKSSACVVL
ncbi:ANK [Mytilus coruscus]|uniref:ANK n=1 Tax=Mytilus coruscus TaxID=42192 RepID=A0A6J8DLM3_MYTCO|nr:ANK [Mytilus coruscus]